MQVTRVAGLGVAWAALLGCNSSDATSCDELRERVDALLATDTSDTSWSAIEANTDRAIELDSLRAELESSECS